MQVFPSVERTKYGNVIMNLIDYDGSSEAFDDHVNNIIEHRVKNKDRSIIAKHNGIVSPSIQEYLNSNHWRGLSRLNDKKSYNEQTHAFVKWISTSEPDSYPKPGEFIIGCGMIVLAEPSEECDDYRLLMITEKHGPNKNRKFPGGLMDTDEGEDGIDTAIRELYEETGIEHIKPISNYSVYNKRRGKDMYMVFFSVLDTSKENAMSVKKCELEIATVEWVPYKEYIEPSEKDSVYQQGLKKIIKEMVSTKRYRSMLETKE